MADATVVNRRDAAFDVDIGRPGPWGNPYGHKGGTLAKFKCKDRAEAVAKHREMLLSDPDLLSKIPSLRGKALGCWCKPFACHGDVLAELANLPPAELDKLIEAARKKKSGGQLTVSEILDGPPSR
jgi:hypothetical protein